MIKDKLAVFSVNTISYALMSAFMLGISISNICVISKYDSWISMLLSILFGGIPLFFYLYVTDKEPNLSLPEINIKYFGKLMGKCINILLLLFAFFYASIVFINLTTFVSSQYLNETPTKFIAIIFLISIIYLLTKGLTVIGRTSVILFFLGMSLELIAFIGLFPQMEINKLLPFMENGFAPVLEGSLMQVGYNILPIFFLSIIPKNDIKNNQNYIRNTILFYLFTSLIAFFIIFITTAILNVNMIKLYQYPSFHLLKRISIAGFITRIESAVSLHWMINFFITISFVLYFVKEMIMKTWNQKNRKIELILLWGLIVLLYFVNGRLFSNNTEANTFLLHTYNYISYAFLFVIPLIPVLRMFLSKKTSS